MSYRAAIDYLYGLQKHGIKLGLEKTGKILSLIGNPQTEFKSIHVAGTNGKGSVSAMTASILMARGYKVGLFTSPHLVSFTERVRINNSEITEAEVAVMTDEIRSKIDSFDDDLTPTFFEVVTAVAFSYFARQKIDWAVIETGMGGRLDATNIVVPAVSVITRIDHDHHEFLGNTITAIAGEKAGIIKYGVPVVSSAQLREAMDVISSVALERNAKLNVFGQDFSSNVRISDIGGTRFDYSDAAVKIENMFTPLAGEYQAENAAVAIKASCVALNCAMADSAKHIKAGLETTNWRGRMELVCNDPPIIVDGAHNAAAAAVLADFVSKHLHGRKIVMIIGIMADKDISDIVKSLLSVATEVVFTSPAYSRAESPQRLAAIACAAGFVKVHVSGSVSEALILAKMRQAKLSAAMPAVIIITGSFYTAGEALEIMGEKSVLSTLREAR
ncbi:MAG TPA: folylpolyglutamate synthase/dihydrofolate synthase family protein [Dissulfurispiraceae bacterium]|nr:folylpolyglutamate synthase/dihydrofolate synthase family protein [Dissulfurispiraceae bacterium]